MKPLSLFTDPSQDIPLTDFLGACIAILGIRDSGKSNSAARLVEQMLTAGVPLTLVDVLGEYWGLKEKFNIVIVGKSAHVDIELTTTEQAAALAVWSLQERVSVILDVSDHDDETRLDLLKAYFEALWKTAGQLRRPYQIVLEEAHNWIPQSGLVPVKPIFTRIAAEGRSRGLSIIMISQRSARVDKNVLTQAGILFLHRVQHGTDVDVYQQLVPSPNRRYVKEVVPALQTGECIFVSKAGFSKLKVLKRETYHAGFTPGMEDVQAPTLTSLSNSTLASLRGLLAAKGSEDDEGPVQPAAIGVLTAKIKELREVVEANINKMAEKDIEINRLMAENARLQQLPQAPSPVGVLPTKSPYGGDQPLVATSRAVKAQEAQFTTLLHDIKNHTTLMHRTILGYLLRRPKQAMSLAELSRWVGYSHDTLSKNPPTNLIHLHMLQRSNIGTRQWKYRATQTRDYLAREFPDLNSDTLLSRILLVCPSE
jgi:hypothetical protein